MTKCILIPILFLFVFSASGSTAYAACKSVPTYGFICPQDLPNITEFKQVCEKGCYLFHPDAAFAAKNNAEMAAYIPNLRSQLYFMQQQRDYALIDADAFKKYSEDLRGITVTLRAERDSRFTWGQVAWITIGGISLGAVAATALYVWLK